jgi:diadenylate cyclase
MIELKSSDLAGAFSELVSLLPQAVCSKTDPKALVQSLLNREHSMTAILDDRIALPHLRLPIKQRYIFLAGWCPNGLEYEGRSNYKDIRLVFLMIAGEDEASYLNMLASLARAFQDSGQIHAVTKAKNLTVFKREIRALLGGSISASTARRSNKFNRTILSHAQKIAEGTDSSAILLFADTFVGGLELTHRLGNFKTVVVTQNSTDEIEERPFVDAVIPVSSFSDRRFAQLRSAVLIGIGRGIFKYNDRVCCVGGISHSNQFDGIVVMDLEREFQSVLTKKLGLLPQSLKPEVVERVLAIATELALQGREGKPVGCLFVLGDSENVKTYTKPLVLNPFYGYREEDRNILSPFMDETVKELSFIDGGFIIRGDGVIESAGTLIHAPNDDVDLPSGLGTRHTAAAAISKVTDCLVVVVSSGSGQVVLFRSGQMLPLMEERANWGGF